MNFLDSKNTAHSWIEISRSALSNNLEFFRKLLHPQAILAPVVKANAYGHGLREIVTLLKEIQVEWICVFSFSEAQRVKDVYPEVNLLVLGSLLPSEVGLAVEEGISFSLYRKDILELTILEAKKQKKLAKIHLKLETGTNRLGFREEELPEILSIIKDNLDFLLVEGIFTHFANIEDSTNHLYAMEQWGKFLLLVEEITSTLKTKPLKHYACSAASLLFGDTVEGMVRLGVSLYGLWPSRETYLSYLLKYGEKRMQNSLQPVMTWKTRILQLKEVKAGETIGYGRTYQVTRPTKIAVLPVGYGDGYDRGLSNKGYVLIRGKRAPIRGRVCMNLTMVDVSDILDIDINDEVVLLGTSGGETIDADQMANWLGTINYEVVTRISPHIPRYIVD